MDFTHTHDRRMLADMASRLVREKYDIATRHKIAAGPGGFSREMWAQFAELGLIGALFEEKSGGFGGQGFDIAVVFEELGRGLVVEPFLANLLAGRLIAEAGSEQQCAMLEEVIGGTLLLALAHGEGAAFYDLAHVATRAQKGDEGWVLNGEKAVVLNGDSADRLVVSARIGGDVSDEEGIALFIVDATAKGVRRRATQTVDGGRAAEVSFGGVKVDSDAVLGEPGAGFAPLERAVGLGILALSAESLGAMRMACDMTLDYLKTRKQFGVPIGAFQALQHRMVEMLMEVEQLSSAVINAAGHLDDPRAVREWHISAAKNLAGRAGRLIAEESIQMHGGIGMTWEYALPHFAKRIVMIDHLFGDEDHHLERAGLLARMRHP